MAKWKKVPPHRNPNYERVSVVRHSIDTLAHLPASIEFAQKRDAVLVVGELGTPLKPMYRKRQIVDLG